MTLQSSGQISFSDIAREFGTPSGRNLGAYRVSQSYGSLSNLPLDEGIPQSGEIKFSDFYSKKLNIALIISQGSRNVARQWYNNGWGVNIVGRFRSKPTSSSGCRVLVNLPSGTYSSLNWGRNYCAFRTGSWDSDTTLRLIIGSGAGVYGSGGRGGDGKSGGMVDGGDGSSALGIEYPTTLINNGYIQRGYGGGGGGGFGTSDPDKNTRDFGAPGGGGGGGAGIPAGRGGSAGGGGYSTSGADRGNDGTSTIGGSGGGGASGGGASGGRGGDGGGTNNGGPSGGGGGGGNITNDGGGGSPGSNGYGIIIGPSGSIISSSGSGSIVGSTVNGTVQ